MFKMNLLVCVGASLMFTLQGAPCTTGSLDDYLNLTNGCEVGDKRFSNFRLGVASTLIGVPASEVITTPLIDGYMFGLRFSGPFAVTGLEVVQDTALHYDVDTVSGLALIIAANAAMDSSTTGLGAITIDEFLFDGLTPYRVTITDNPINVRRSDSTAIVPTNHLSVFKDVFLSGGGVGSASLASFDQTFTQIPEPGSAMLAAPAILALAAFAARKSARARKV